MSEVRAVAVVVPAKDEEQLLPASLDALAAASAHVGDLDVVTVVAASGEGTVRAAARAGVPVVATEGTVGAARARGVQVARELLGEPSPDRLWCLATDADSVVPADWIARHVAWADRGWDAVLGTVEVADWSDHVAATRRMFERAYRRGLRPRAAGVHDAHRHVHGANLGVRGSAYDAVGGFPQTAVDEDVLLVSRLRDAGHRIAWTTDLPVTTSARSHGRAHGGFATYVARLAASTHPRSGTV